MDRLKNSKLLLFCLLGITGFFPAIASSKEILKSAQSGQKIITIFSESLTNANPDVAIVTFYFTGYGWTVYKARKKADQLIQKFTERISKEQLKIKEIEIGDARLKPSYQFNRDLKTNVPSDFLVSRRVSVQIEDFTAVEKLMDISISLGSFMLESAVLTVKDKNELRMKAFREAIEEGKKKADGIARSLGLDSGEILEVEEQDSFIQEINLIQSNEFADIVTRQTNLKMEEEKQAQQELPSSAQDSISPYTESVRANAKLKITFQIK